MSLIPISSKLYTICKELAQSRRMVFLAGLPGTGKSLLIQQLARIATEMGREVHLLQYTPARAPFESQPILSRYPEVEGVTDPTIRKALGLWARDIVDRWNRANPAPNQMLIGELPLIGNRLLELVLPLDDASEAWLTASDTEFIIPVPSWEVREVIEERRAQTLAAPRDEQEKLEAAPAVLQDLWYEINTLARNMGLTKAATDASYNPYIYGGVYTALLQHRPTRAILIEQILSPDKSVYEWNIDVHHLIATDEEAERYVNSVESSFTPSELVKSIEQWHSIVTDHPIQPDPGPQLRLPLPSTLPGMRQQTILNDEEKGALQALLALPLDCELEGLLPVLDAAMAILEPAGSPQPVTANVKKFDVYDSYFNVVRTDEGAGIPFITGLLRSYRNVLTDLTLPPQTLTVIELPLLRLALEASLRQFL